MHWNIDRSENRKYKSLICKNTPWKHSADEAFHIVTEDIKRPDIRFVHQQSIGSTSAPPGTRTPDTLIKSQVLYQLS